MNKASTWTEEERAIVLANSTMPTRELATLLPMHTPKAVGVFRHTHDKNYAPSYANMSRIVIDKTYVQGEHNFKATCERLCTIPKREKQVAIGKIKTAISRFRRVATEGRMKYK